MSAEKTQEELDAEKAQAATLAPGITPVNQNTDEVAPGTQAPLGTDPAVDPAPLTEGEKAAGLEKVDVEKEGIKNQGGSHESLHPAQKDPKEIKKTQEEHDALMRAHTAGPLPDEKQAWDNPLKGVQMVAEEKPTTHFNAETGKPIEIEKPRHADDDE